MQVSFKKKNFKKIILALLCNLLIVFNLVSCGWNGEDCVKKLGDEEINFSEFLLLTSLKAVSSRGSIKGDFAYDDFSFEVFKEGEIDGGAALEYIKNQVSDEMEEILIKRMAAKKLNVSLTEQEKEGIKKNGYERFKSLNSSFKASKIGISLKDCENLVLWDLLENKIGEQLYGKGKPGEIKEEDVMKFLKDKKNVMRFKFLKIPKELKKEENKEESKDKKDKEESIQEKLEKKFSVKNSKELAENMLKKINGKKKSLEDVKKELQDGLGKDIASLEEKVSYLNEKDEQSFNPDEDYKFNEGVKKFLKEMEEKKEKKKIFETDTHIYIIETLEMDDETGKKEKEKAKGIKEKEAREDFLKKIRKEFKEKIETEESKFNISVVSKQIKKVCENKVKVSQFPF